MSTITLAALGFLQDLVSVETRLLVLGVGACLGVAGVTGTWLAGRERQANQDQISALSTQLRAAQNHLGTLSPVKSLEALSTVLFSGTGAWRLTVYTTERDEGGKWWLRRLARQSGSEMYATSGRERIELERSFLREIPSVDLRDPRRPFVNESAAFPNREASPDEWLTMQRRLLSDRDARGLTMPSRKYAWCATWDEVSQHTVALVAESVETDAIAIAEMGTPLVAQTLTMIVRLTELPVAVSTPVAEVAAILGARVQES